jgi:outer membrane lipoprotein-sorting protein
VKAWPGARLAASAAWLAVAALALAGAASADLTVKGDEAAWQELRAAYAKLNALSGYRMKSSMPGGGSMLVEVTSGGTAMHMVVHSASGDVESYMMGGQMRMKMNVPGSPQTWQCQNAPTSMAPQIDLAKLEGTVDVARGQDTAIDGAPMHVYTYALSAPVVGGAAKTTLFVDTVTGLPRRMIIATPAGEQTMDYYDYDARIKFTLPACGSARAPARRRSC